MKLPNTSGRELSFAVKWLANLIGILLETNIQLVCSVLSLGVVSVRSGSSVL